MIQKIAWRNIWRNKIRSAVVILAIAAGVWSVILLSGFTRGFSESYINNVVDKELGHIQIHQKGYQTDPGLKHSIKNPKKIEDLVSQNAAVKAVSYRMVVNGMISSGHGVRGVKAIGILPKLENKVLSYNKMIIEGTNVDSSKHNPLLISKRLADELKLSLSKKTVLTFQDTLGNMVSAAFRICGIYESNNKNFDNSHIYLRYQDLEKLTGAINRAQEIIIRCKNEPLVNNTVNELQTEFPKLKVQSYSELAPEINLFKEQIESSNYLYMVIFMLALIFGIINTMLMAVLERFRELGMLMAVGLNRTQVFFMIVLETLYLAIVSIPIGLVLAWLTVHQLKNTGLDLSAWSKGLNQFGMNSIIYPTVSTTVYWEVAIAVCITALIGAIYPAIKAIRLKPVEAIRKI